MIIEDLGLMPYRDAWARQEAAHAEVVDGGAERLFLVEHPPVITLGRRPGLAKNLLAPPEQLAAMGVELVETDRGGDVTFHGPGQLVAYPIVRLNQRRLSVGGYVRRLLQVAIATLADFQITAQLDPSAVGVWTATTAGQLAKICALGVRIRRGVSMHGIALNVTTDLRYFNLIIPCGLSRPVTSITQVMEKAPEMERVKGAMARRMIEAFPP